MGNVIDVGGIVGIAVVVAAVGDGISVDGAGDGDKTCVADTAIAVASVGAGVIVTEMWGGVVSALRSGQLVEGAWAVVMEAAVAREAVSMVVRVAVAAGVVCGVGAVFVKRLGQ